MDIDNDGNKNNNIYKYIKSKNITNLISIIKIINKIVIFLMCIILL